MEFNLLPLEVRLEIFSYLSNREAMKIRLVCKLWNGLINSEFKFKQLRCQQKSDYYFYPKPWCEYDFHMTSAIPFLRHACNDLKFRRIEYLVADLDPSAAEVKDAFEFLNSLKWLKKARFSCLVSTSERVPLDQVVVNLDRLEKFDFYFSTSPRIPVILNLPSLHYLALCVFVKTVTIGHPEKLRTLVAERAICEWIDYSPFTGLTRICCARRDVIRVTASFIKRLPSLREIHLKDFDNLDEYRSAGLNEEEPCLPVPLGQKKAVRIFYCGIEVSLEQIRSEGDQWHNLFWELERTEETARFITRNLQNSADNNREIKSINYNTIAEELNDEEMFGILPQKFPKISDIEINGNVADENRLLKFLDQFKPEWLYFCGGIDLPRSFFFDKLAQNRPFIQHLSIEKEDDSMDILSGDLDFCFQFENLKRLCLYDFPLSLNFVSRLIKGLKSIDYIRFYVLQEHSEAYEFDVSLADGLQLEAGYSRFNALGDWKSNSFELVHELNRRLKVDEYVRPKKLLALVRQMDFEQQNSLFMMRMYVYEQRHSIGMPKEMMCLLNSPH